MKRSREMEQSVPSDKQMADMCLLVTGLLSLFLLGALLPEPAAAAASCPPDQYPETSGGRNVCCDFCSEDLQTLQFSYIMNGKNLEGKYRKRSDEYFTHTSTTAGQEIQEVCTPSNKASKCRNCVENRYNPKNARDRCQRCTVCDKAEGSIEKKPCTKGTDAICECPEGSTPKNDRKTACRCDKGKEIVNNKCQPCKSGYFSDKENSICRPWTDCSALGQTIMEQGSAVRDVKCTKPTPSLVTLRIPTTSLTPATTRPKGKATSPQNVTTTNPISISVTPMSNNSHYWGTLSLILIGAVLLVLSAGIILTMITQINHKKNNRGFIRGERFRVPIQEESTSSDSSLPKECPA
ncbi:LOW QUALITY PROTEIN: tumor necrosis factor receptor superfamily member 4 [Hyla sarda]|uniref:LOW QUALITY PROTEIN: tumor necrosis factor receptor superfamily member 4 n=1 Tax=Hyla sarda TaxID=327740 RepID=UPI0024C331D5|nr:LOW QUALITY PROTEIN: tumor necrosis factor receptor superfamily member 4 [Hyla sarda]